MVRLLVSVMFLVMCLGIPRLAPAADMFDPDQPFQQAMTMNLLRSLLNQALDRLDDHVEISGNLSQGDSNADRSKSLHFKFYPEGKSKSDRHLSAEGSFRSALESGQLDWHFRFKLPDGQSKEAPQQFDAPL